MKREKLVTFACGAALSFLVSFGTIACLVSAFEMQISLPAVAGVLLLGAVLCSGCYSLPLGLAPAGIMALGLGYLFRSGKLHSTAEALLNRLTRQYDRAYGWGIVRWSMRTADEMEPDMLLALCLVGLLIGMLTAWSVCRRKTALPGILLSLLPFGACVVVTDTVPGSFWLYLYFLGLLILLLTASVRKNGAQHGNRLTVACVVPVAVVLLLLFGLTPRSGYKGDHTAKQIADSLRTTPVVEMLLERLGVQQPGVNGSNPDGVDLSVVGQRSSSTAKIMDIRSSYSGRIYLRGRAMDVYDGKNWTNSGDMKAALLWPEKMGGKESVSVATRFAHRMLYVPYYVESFSLDGVAVGLENNTNLTEYSFACSPMPDQAQLLQLYPAVNMPLDFMARGRLLQEITLKQQVRKWAEPLAQKLTKDLRSPYQMAQAIGNYVRSSAAYDTQTVRMPRSEPDFARWFLEDSDTGYCVHFASATTVLLQAAGLPARYVTGYTVMAKAGETVEVTADMAHAWAEYYLPGFGWTVLEATPGDFTDAPVTTEPSDTPEQTEDSTLPEATAPTTEKAPASSGAAPQIRWGAVWTGLAVVAALVALWGQRLLRRFLRRRRYDKAAVNEKALLCWKQLTLLWRFSNDAGDKDLFALAQKAGFSQHTLTQQELEQLEQQVEDAVKTLKKRSVFHRMFCCFVLAY